MTAAPAWEKLALTVLRKADPPGELGVKALRKKVVKRAAKKQASADLAQLREAFDAALPTLRGVSVRGDVARIAEAAEAAGGAAAAREKRPAPDADARAAKPPKKAKKAATGAAAGELDAAGAAAWRDAHQVRISEEAFAPIASWESAARALPASLVEQCVGAGFAAPSPVQAAGWPVLVAGRDLVAVAETGSGKTLGFALPALARIGAERGAGGGAKPRKGAAPAPDMLVLSPTRELAQQSAAVIERFGASVGVKCVCLYGGVPKHEQRRALGDAACRVVVATPGRLVDLVERDGALALGSVRWLVLDEADRMLDMGFVDEVRRLAGACASARQTCMFTATWPVEVSKIASELMLDAAGAVRVAIGGAGGAALGLGGDDGRAVGDEPVANKRVTQEVEVIGERERDARLLKLLQRYHSSRKNRVIVFGLYKKECARLELQLQRAGWTCVAIHGDKAQAARDSAFGEFKSGAVPLLIATDVAARGLDIPNVEVVINFSFPLTIEDYVHRIGRTGRAGTSGISHTFFHDGDKAHAGSLQNVLREANQPIPDALMKYGSTVKKKEHKLYGAFGPKGGAEMKKATKITFD